MKKCTLLVSMLLIAALLVVGCGETPAEPTETLQEPLEAMEETMEETTEAVETEETQEISAPAVGASLGTVTENTYTNAYVGFGVEFGADWVLLPAEELQEIPSEIQEMLKGTEMDDAKTAQTQIMDMQAQNLQTGASVNVLYQGTDAMTRSVYSTMTDEQIADTVLDQKDQMIASYAQAGLEVSEMDKVTVHFLGAERVALKTVATVEDMEMVMLQIFDFHLDGSFVVTTTFSAFSQTDLDALMAAFHPL